MSLCFLFAFLRVLLSYLALGVASVDQSTLDRTQVQGTTVDRRPEINEARKALIRLVEGDLQKQLEKSLGPGWASKIVDFLKSKEQMEALKTEKPRVYKGINTTALYQLTPADQGFL